MLQALSVTWHHTCPIWLRFICCRYRSAKDLREKKSRKKAQITTPSLCSDLVKRYETNFPKPIKAFFFSPNLTSESWRRLYAKARHQLFHSLVSWFQCHWRSRRMNGCNKKICVRTSKWKAVEISRDKSDQTRGFRAHSIIESSKLTQICFKPSIRGCNNTFNIHFSHFR